MGKPLLIPQSFHHKFSRHCAILPHRCTIAAQGFCQLIDSFGVDHCHLSTALLLVVNLKEPVAKQSASCSFPISTQPITVGVRKYEMYLEPIENVATRQADGRPENHEMHFNEKMIST